MITLALDPGAKRVGIAVSDATGFLAVPLDAVAPEPLPAFTAALGKILEAREVEKILVGLPRHLDGRESEAAKAARAWVEKWRASVRVPIEFIDERLSTVEASRRLQEAGLDARAQRSRIDSASAAVFLQAYLDARGARAFLPPLEAEEDEARD